MIEGFTFEQKTIEGFNFVPDSQPETVKFSNNLQHKSNINDSMDIIISKQYYDLSKNVLDLSQNYTNTYKNPKYRHIVFPDKTDMIKTTEDVRKKDINNILLQENYMYIMGTITCATLLIAAIIISK